MLISGVLLLELGRESLFIGGPGGLLSRLRLHGETGPKTQHLLRGNTRLRVRLGAAVLGASFALHIRVGGRQNGRRLLLPLRPLRAGLHGGVLLPVAKKRCFSTPLSVLRTDSC